MKDESSGLKQKHTFADFVYWNTVMAVPFVTACIGLAPVSVLGLIGYIVLCLSLATVIYRFFCTHCPHYAQSNGKTRCMFFWGMPGFFTAVPGPYNRFSKAVAVAAPLVMALFPLGWLRLQPGLLVIYALSLAVALATLRRSECHRCVHAHCPANCAPETQKGAASAAESTA